MKTYEIRVTQDLHGYYQGTIEIAASSPNAALNKLKNMSPAKIDEITDWTHGDEYDGDLSSIEIDETSVEEI